MHFTKPGVCFVQCLPSDFIIAEEFVVASSMRVVGSTMFASKRFVGLLRRIATVLVEREQVRVGSRMVAYENIGAQIGASSWWVRSLVKGYDDERDDIAFSPAFNLWALYERLCDRIELDNYDQAMRIAALQREVYEAAPRALAEMAADAGRKPASKDTPEPTPRSGAPDQEAAE